MDLKALVKSAGRRSFWIPAADAVQVALERADIEQLIPHRDPFLLLDGITDISLTSQSIRGRRRIDPGDPVLRGHFPGRPVYPGVLQLESIGQLGLCLLQFLSAQSVAIPSSPPPDIRAVSVHAARFYDAVLPGDDLTLVCRVIARDEYTATCAGQVVRGDIICSFGVMEVYFVDG